MRRVKPIHHEAQVSLVDHLDELRARIVVSISVFGVALALCFWQNHLLLELAGGPLPSGHTKLLTLGITEPFTTSLTVSAYGAIILSMPILLYEAYAYLLPAFSKQQQRQILPLLLMIPALFIAGIAFGFFVVLPAATKLPPPLQRPPVQHPGPGEPVLRLLRPDPARLRDRLPDPGRHPRRHPPRHRPGRPADQQPSLRLPRLRDRRRGAARHRPGVDAPRDRPPDRPLRAQHRPRPHLGHAPRTGRADRAGGLIVECLAPTRRQALA